MSKITLGESFLVSEVRYKIEFLRTYEKNGDTMYIYLLEDKEPEWYKKYAGKYYMVDKITGRPMYFTSRDCGDSDQLVWSECRYWDSGNIYGMFFPSKHLGF